MEESGKTAQLDASFQVFSNCTFEAVLLSLFCNICRLCSYVMEVVWNTVKNIQHKVTFFPDRT